MKVGVYGRTVLLVALVAVPPLVLVGLVLVDRNQAALRIDADEFHLSLAERVRADLGSELTRGDVTLERLMNELLAPGEESLHLRAIAQRLEADDTPFSFVSVYSADGSRRGTVRRSEERGDGPQTLPAELREATMKRGAPVVRGGHLVIPVALSARDLAGETVWLYAEHDLRGFEAHLKELAIRPPLRNAESLVVFDERRDVLMTGAGVAATRTSLAESGLFAALKGDLPLSRETSLATEYADADVKMLGALATVPPLRWTVLVRRPQAQAYESLGALRLFVAAVVLAALVVALLASFLGARFLTRPLAALAEATRALSSRTFAGVPEVVTRRGDEVGDLGRSFDAMATSLKASEAQVVAETKVRAALSRYLAPDVVDRVVASPETLKLGGERRLVTVFFADIVGFTRLSETLPPETIVALLNEVFTIATEIIHRRGGMVDKFIGDSVMAVWGLPENKEGDSERAVAAAEDLRRWVETGNRRWKKQWGVEVQLAIGIHTGHVVAGNVGSERRMEYTVIGDAVNVAARLEAAAEPGQILISDSTRRELKGSTSVELKAVGSQTLRGRATETNVYEVTS